ncbi:MAG TPA: PKD domain-containing protein [Bacteroidales bacterium]
MKKLSILLAVVLVVFSSCERVMEPRADFEVSKSTVNTYEEIKFFNSSREALEYEWDFGDGYVSNDYEPVHYYTQPGHYTVKLSAYNHGIVDYAFINIDVTAPPTILNVQVLETFTKLPVSGASILIYPTYTDWLNETNSIKEIFTDERGIAIIEGLEPNYYYLDVWEKNHNNYALASENMNNIKTPYLLNEVVTYFTAWVDYVPSTQKSKTVRRAKVSVTNQPSLMTNNVRVSKP